MKELSKRTRRSFVVGGLSFAAGILGLRWIFTRREEMGLPWPLRKILEINEGIFGDLFSRRRLAPAIARVTGKQPRVNGDLGLGDERDFGGAPDFPGWRLRVGALTLSMREIRALPRTEYSFGFNCIEGWKEDMTVAGVKFSDFLDHNDIRAHYPYVGLETPDGKYYVSIDRESMLHPQTLLCYEMNGAPLAFDNGAPLRLIIPVKYGIKSLKQLGRIFFADSRPPDYWAERGYDWYAGL